LPLLKFQPSYIVECEVHVLVFVNYWIEKCTVKHWEM